MFLEQIPLDADVDWLDKETVDAEVKMKVVDEYIRIDGRLYGIEFEQDDNMDISMKVFDYSLRGARRYGTTSERDATVMVFPRVCAVFLRSNANTPESLKWVFLFPDGQSVELSVPVIRLENLSVAEIKKRNLLPIGQFKPRTFDPLSERNIDEFHATITQLKGALIESVADGSITLDNAKAMWDSIKAQMENAYAKTDMEVDEIMVTSITETFPWTDYKEAFDEIRAEVRPLVEAEVRPEIEAEVRAKVEAETEAKRDMAIALSMFRNLDNSASYITRILKAAGIPDEIINEAMQQVKAERSIEGRQRSESER